MALHLMCLYIVNKMQYPFICFALDSCSEWLIYVIWLFQAICSKSTPCLNGGTCDDTSGTCKCKAYYVGDTCDIPVGKN